MATSKLEIYNGALLNCKQRFLASLSEDNEARRLLDHVWDSRGVRACLEKAIWNFAIRAQEVDADPAIDPAFGYQFAFARPDDFVTLGGIWQDEGLSQPLLKYADEANIWYANIDPIYVEFVSDDPTFGLDLSLWPESFTEYVKMFFASKIAIKLVGTTKEVIHHIFGPPGFPRRGALHRSLLEARGRDARLSPTRFPPESSWNRSRRAGRGGDRGNRNRLIG